MALIVFALAGCAWFVLELVPPAQGFEDTDDPAVSLAFLREQPQVYATGGTALLIMALALLVAVLDVSEMLSRRTDPLPGRVTGALGCLAAAALLMQGVLRLGVEPLRYIDGLDRRWGEAAYLALQVIGVHGFAQAALLCLSAWVAAVAVLGWRTRRLPRALCLVAVLPVSRLLVLGGPLGLGPLLPDLVWVLVMAAIPVLLIWCLVLGLVLVLRRGQVARRAHSAVAPTAPG